MDWALFPGFTPLTWEIAIIYNRKILPCYYLLDQTTLHYILFSNIYNASTLFHTALSMFLHSNSHTQLTCPAKLKNLAFIHIYSTMSSHTHFQTVTSPAVYFNLPVLCHQQTTDTSQVPSSPTACILPLSSRPFTSSTPPINKLNNCGDITHPCC